MAMIARDSWHEKFIEEEFPGPWTCPSCQKSNLLIKPGTFFSAETEQSKSARNHIAWEPEWTRGRAHGILICANSNCKEEVVFCCETQVDYVGRGEDGDPLYGTFIHPKLFFPALHPFNLSKNIPTKIKTQIECAFEVFWCDRLASANRIRTSIELILDHLRISKRPSTRKGVKTRRYSLHERIEFLKKKQPDLAALMLAVKWIGNAGSHGDSVSNDDVLDGYELLEKVVEEVFDGRSARLSRTASKINKAKRPLSHRLKKKENPEDW